MTFFTCPDEACLKEGSVICGTNLKWFYLQPDFYSDTKPFKLSY